MVVHIEVARIVAVHTEVAHTVVDFAVAETEYTHFVAAAVGAEVDIVVAVGTAAGTT